MKAPAYVRCVLEWLGVAVDPAETHLDDDVMDEALERVTAKVNATMAELALLAGTAEHVRTRIEWFNAEGKLLGTVEVPRDTTAVRYDPDSGAHMPLAPEPPAGTAHVVGRLVFEKAAPQTVLALSPEIETGEG